MKGGSNNGFSKTHGPQAPFVNLSCNDTLFGGFLSVLLFFFFFFFLFCGEEGRKEGWE